MKRLLKRFVIILIALKISSSMIATINFREGIKTFILIAAFLTLFDYIIRPILKFLLIPINMLTLGLFRGLVETFGLYLATIIVPSFTIEAFRFIGISWQGFNIPSLSLNLFWTYVFASFLIGFIITILKWIFRE